MTKKQSSLIILAAVVLSLLVNVFFGRWLSAKLSTWPLLNRLKLVSPESPIVINTREEVRVSDSGEIDQAVSKARSKVSLVVSNLGNQVNVLGGAINLTSDGYFVTVKSVVDGQKQQNLFIKLDDGTISQVTEVTRDPATGLEILKTNLNSVPVADLADSKNLISGQRIIFLGSTAFNFYPAFAASFVSQSEQAGGEIKDADIPSRAFKVQAAADAAPGQAIVDASGQIDGLWDGAAIVSSDVIKNIFSLFLSGQGAITRPAYGFRYRSVTPAEQAILALPPGIKVVSVAAVGAAQKAGLAENDIIQLWNGADLSGDVSLEELLQRSKPGDELTIKVMRGKNSVNLKLTVGEQK